MLISSERHFRAMGTDVDIVILTTADGMPKAVLTHDAVERRIADFERRFSRFLPDSELSRFNRAGGKPFPISGEMITLLKAALKWHADTDRVFDPTVIGALESFGYEKSVDFDRGPAESDGRVDLGAHQARFQNRVPFSSLEIDEKKKTARAPGGLRLDFGGIGKGYAVDAAAGDIRSSFDNFWISAGGDMYVSVRNLDGSFWKIDVQDPFDLEKSIGYIQMEDIQEYAVATSGVMKRKGKRGKFSWHHIINPRTGLPADTDIVAVTVLASTVTAADVLAKSALILGRADGMALIGRHAGADCIMIDSKRRVYFSRRMENNFTFYK